MMIRILVFIVLMLTLPFTAAMAQEVISVRAGEHSEYTRLVFDWPKKVGFTISDKKADSITVNFEAAAQIESGIKGDNLLGLEVNSNNPLSVVVKIPEGAKTRAFPLSSRVVVDIYKTAAQKAAQSSEDKKQEKPSPTKAETKTGQASNTSQSPDEEELQSIKEAVEKVESIVQVLKDNERSLNPEQQEAPPNFEEKSVSAEPAPEKQGEPQERQPSRTIESIANDQTRTNRFTLSATESIGMAVFLDFGKIWMITDKPDSFVRPKVNGPNADYFKPIEEKSLNNGKAFLSKTSPDTFIFGQGGGLLWNIIVSPYKPDDENYKPVMPQRINVDDSKVRSGRILWPLESAQQVIDLVDPVSGSNIKVVTVEDANDFAGEGKQFVDFDVLPSPIGLAIRPKTDDLQVSITAEGVEIFRDGGLAILPQDKVASVERESFEDRMNRGREERRIFNFGEWRMGGLDVLNENENVILSSMPEMTKSTQIENLITLAKMELSNGRGAEALGFLEYAQVEMPELVQNPEFMSLRGVAKAFAWKTDDAFQDLSSPVLQDFEEIQMWRAFALADLGDWQQAREVLPENLAPLKDYPPEVLNRIGVVLAEIFLRAGEVKKAEQLFDLKEDDKLNTANSAALKYLQGESARQKGDMDTTKKLWEELSEGEDDLYRVKAGLALTRLLMQEKSITPKEAIDRLERLRYAWRGDELEAQINYWLGRTYFEDAEYVKGLSIMRDAASLAPETVLGQRIARDMSSLFTDFFMDESLKEVSPVDSVSLYEQFQELVPPGEKGNQVISNLAEHMVQADLLDRASGLLKYQIDHRLSGDEAARTATRLAAINLIDKNPRDALAALNKAVGFLRTLPEEQATKSRFQELSLLRARALSQDGKTDQALAILEDIEPSREVNRLRADIAWQSGFWDDASYALEDVILDENISLTRPLIEEHAMLILQRAVAQNLSGDRIGLANLREKYGEAMNQTNKARLFDVVTRPRQSSGLADRDTLLSTVAEIDLFGEFLNSYKDVDGRPSN